MTFNLDKEVNDELILHFEYVLVYSKVLNKQDFYQKALELLLDAEKLIEKYSIVNKE